MEKNKMGIKRVYVNTTSFVDGNGSKIVRIIKKCIIDCSSAWNKGLVVELSDSLKMIVKTCNKETFIGAIISSMTTIYGRTLKKAEDEKSEIGTKRISTSLKQRQWNEVDKEITIMRDNYKETVASIVDLLTNKKHKYSMKPIENKRVLFKRNPDDEPALDDDDDVFIRKKASHKKLRPSKDLEEDDDDDSDTDGEDLDECEKSDLKKIKKYKDEDFEDDGFVTQSKKKHKEKSVKVPNEKVDEDDDDDSDDEDYVEDYGDDDDDEDEDDDDDDYEDDEDD